MKSRRNCVSELKGPGSPLFPGSLWLQRPGLSGCEPPGFHPDPWLAPFHRLFDSCREKRERTEAGEGQARSCS